MKFYYETFTNEMNLVINIGCYLLNRDCVGGGTGWQVRRRRRSVFCRRPSWTVRWRRPSGARRFRSTMITR